MASAGESQLPGLPGFDPDNIQPWTVQVVASMTVLAVVAVGLRLVSRHIMGQKLWWDDWMIIFSMVRTLSPPPDMARPLSLFAESEPLTGMSGMEFRSGGIHLRYALQGNGHPRRPRRPRKHRRHG